MYYIQYNTQYIFTFISIFIQRKEIDDVSDTSSQSETDEVSEITIASQPVVANLKIESSVQINRIFISHLRLI